MLPHFTFQVKTLQQRHQHVAILFQAANQDSTHEGSTLTYSHANTVVAYSKSLVGSYL
jgi:hypothetical protein